MLIFGGGGIGKMKKKPIPIPQQLFFNIFLFHTYNQHPQ
jgi:hypothetical protein